MTRKEQIEEVAYSDPDTVLSSAYRQGFINGALWADKNPLDYCRDCFDRKAKEYMEASIDRLNKTGDIPE